MAFLAKLFKNIFVFSNLLIALSDLLLIGFSLTQERNFENIFKTSSEKCLYAFAVTVGVLVLLVSILGIIGAVKENKFILLTYSIIMVVLLILQCILGTMAIIYFNNRNNLETMRGHIRNRVERLFNDPDKAESVHKEQGAFRCCGIDGYSYWNNAFPDSCCEIAPCSISNVFKEGCVENNLAHFSGCIEVIAGIALGFIAFEVAGVILAFLL